MPIKCFIAVTNLLHLATIFIFKLNTLSSKHIFFLISANNSKLYTHIYLYIILMLMNCWVNLKYFTLQLAAIFVLSLQLFHLADICFSYLCEKPLKIHIHTHTCTQTSACIELCMSSYIHTYLHKYIIKHIIKIHIFLLTSINTHTGLHTNIHRYIHVCLQTCISRIPYFQNIGFWKFCISRILEIPKILKTHVWRKISMYVCIQASMSLSVRNAQVYVYVYICK